MIKTIKSNKFISLLLIIVCIIIIINPTIYAKSCLEAISVWALKILPLMFPFFILTRLIVNLSQSKPNFLDKCFNTLYRVPNGSFSTYFLSVLSGYPMGAKLIHTMHEKNRLTKNEAITMLSLCSVSGPIFMIGTVGVSIFYSYKAGLIILISNILASLINGLIFRNKTTESNVELHFEKKDNSSLLTDCVYDSLVSILMVGAFIVLSFLIIDILKNLNVIYFLSNSICSVLSLNNSHHVVQSLMNGLIEMTHGLLDLSQTNISLSLKTVLASGLIGFGGLSILLQSISFLSKLKIPVKTMLIQKSTQCVLATLLSIPFCLIFL